MNAFRKYLNMPFYDTCNMKDNARLFAFIGLFVAFFLWFFEPFGISNYTGNKFLLAMQFGLITFISGLFVEFIQIRLIGINKEHPSWTFGKWLISILALILAISSSNYLFINYLSGWDEWSLVFFGRMIVNTAAIGLFPTVVAGLISIHRHTKEFSEVAKGLSDWTHHSPDTTELVLPSRSGEDLVLMAESIYFLESQQNYVLVNYKDQSLKQELIRNTLKEISEVLPEQSFFQSHRSFIVNLDHVNQVTGNSQGLVLHLESGETVPVSRTFIPAFRQRWS